MDQANFLEGLFSVLDESSIRYCVIGGLGVNAYVEPLVSLDLDLVVAAEDLERAEAVLRSHMEQDGSKLRVQIQTDPRYGAFVERASQRDVLGLPLPVAQVEDILQGKIWAASDETQRPSKRRKDILDIERLIELYPQLRDQVPEAILRRISDI